MRKVIEDFIGCCQACLGEFKVNERRRIVLHGYRRPGIGEVIGQCRGVDHPPLEHEKALTTIVALEWRTEREDLERRLGKLRAGEIKTLIIEHEERDPATRTRRRIRETIGPDHANWSWRLGIEIANVEGDIRYADAMHRYFQLVVDRWKPGIVIGIDQPPTGRERAALKEAYDPDRETARQASEEARAARSARPGKLKIDVVRDNPNAGLEPDRKPGSRFSTEWVNWRERQQQEENAWRNRIRTWAKTTFGSGGAVRVGEGWSGVRNRDLTEVRIDWSFREQIAAFLPGSTFKLDGPKRIDVTFDETKAKAEGQVIAWAEEGPLPAPALVTAASDQLAPAVTTTKARADDLPPAATAVAALDNDDEYLGPESDQQP